MSGEQISRVRKVLVPLLLDDVNEMRGKLKSLLGHIKLPIDIEALADQTESHSRFAADDDAGTLQ